MISEPHTLTNIMSTEQPRLPIEARRAAKPASSGNQFLAVVLCLFFLAFVLWAFVFSGNREKPVKFTTPYQAVLLSNGAVYYGKLEGYGTRAPLLTNVFYILTRQDPNTKATSNVLVKRGKELHGPDRMYLTPNSIVFVETVTSGSKVAQLIQQANSQP